MKAYTFSEARQNLASVLDTALREGGMRIRRRDGQSFVLTPESSSASPLEADGVDLRMTRSEIVGFVRESRREYG